MNEDAYYCRRKLVNMVRNERERSQLQRRDEEEEEEERRLRRTEVFPFPLCSSRTS